MLTLDLPELERKGAIERRVGIEAGDPLWADSGIRLVGPVEVRIRGSVTVSGEPYLQIDARGVSLGTCRRCLEEVRMPFEVGFSLLVQPPEEGVDEEEGVLFVDPSATKVDLAPKVREEVLLAIPEWPLCRSGCRGLCPRCGVNRNEVECACAEAEPDPRWDALRALKRND